MDRWDETWRALREWTDGQARSERLAAHVLANDGFERIDPSHPLGGPDEGGDANASKGGIEWVLGVYFATRQLRFGQIKKKLLKDLGGTRAKRAEGFAFVTNQELSLSERTTLKNLVKGKRFELYHLERITHLLDQPEMASIRQQYLGITSTGGTIREELDAALTENSRRLEGLQTGGSTFCWAFITNFDMESYTAREFSLVKVGEFPLYDVRFRIVDLENNTTKMSNSNWGETNAPADYMLTRFTLNDTHYFRIFFHARNGDWRQDMQLRRSEVASCWLSTTRIYRGPSNDVVFEREDHEWRAQFGDAFWRP